ncbi:MAG: type II secretion system protein GspG [Rhodanobacteraceae bacterium]|nr:type II secretion system protein GspG [Rhodanobacteraceae bacterium]HPF72867.1 type II secretion system protein GspG [Xanthomonadaceae bacterium]HRX99108.1 type II secretion system protein GspG [Xanthomonadaceae bacterium]
MTMAAEKGVWWKRIKILSIVFGILFAIGWWAGFGLDDSEIAKHHLTRAMAKSLASSVEACASENGRIPVTLEVLLGRNAEPGQSQSRLREGSLYDAWGRKFRLKVLDSARSFQISSLGKDDREGGNGVDADIVLTIHLAESVAR